MAHSDRLPCRYRGVTEGWPFPYTLRAFQAALTAEGFQVVDAGVYGSMVYGLVLRCDLLSCGIEPSQPGESIKECQRDLGGFLDMLQTCR